MFQLDQLKVVIDKKKIALQNEQEKEFADWNKIIIKFLQFDWKVFSSPQYSLFIIPSDYHLFFIEFTFENIWFSGRLQKAHRAVSAEKDKKSRMMKFGMRSRKRIVNFWLIKVIVENKNFVYNVFNILLALSNTETDRKKL